MVNSWIFLREFPDDERSEGSREVSVQPSAQLYRGVGRGQALCRDHRRLSGKETFLFTDIGSKKIWIRIWIKKAQGYILGKILRWEEGGCPLGEKRKKEGAGKKMKEEGKRGKLHQKRVKVH